MTVLGRVSMAMFTGFLMWGLLSMSPALADEFEVAIVVGEDVDASEFMDGFQLAVDESPDVSHPPDTEGGDHLGSMDVVVAVSDDGNIPGTGSVPIVVADISADALGTATARKDPAPPIVILITDIATTDDPVPEGVFVLTRAGAEEMALNFSSSFEADFAAVNGYQPSPVAARGYTSGKLVDIAVEATDRDPTDVATLMAALEAETTDETGPKTTVPPATTSASSPSESGGRSLVPPGLIAVIVVVLAIVGVMYIRDSRRREPPNRS